MISWENEGRRTRSADATGQRHRVRRQGNASGVGIVPCGVSEQRYGVTSLADLGLPVSMPEVDMVLRREFEALFGLSAYAVASTENDSPGARSLRSSSVPSR